MARKKGDAWLARAVLSANPELAFVPWKGVPDAESRGLPAIWVERKLAERGLATRLLAAAVSRGAEPEEAAARAAETEIKRFMRKASAALAAPRVPRIEAERLAELAKRREMLETRLSLLLSNEALAEFVARGFSKGLERALSSFPRVVSAGLESLTKDVSERVVARAESERLDETARNVVAAVRRRI